jgi:hypothetical protein
MLNHHWKQEKEKLILELTLKRQTNTKDERMACSRATRKTSAYAHVISLLMTNTAEEASRLSLPQN